MAYDEGLAARVRACLEGHDGITERAMFGGLAFLVGGNMAVAVTDAGGLMVRVDPAHSESLTAQAHVAPMEMRGRALVGWLLVDAPALASDAGLARWVAVGTERAGSLPPKDGR